MIKELMLKFDYGWRMRGLWLVLHIISIYSAIMAPQYIGWALLFAVMATAQVDTQVGIDYGHTKVTRQTRLENIFYYG